MKKGGSRLRVAELCRTGCADHGCPGAVWAWMAVGLAQHGVAVGLVDIDASVAQRRGTIRSIGGRASRTGLMCRIKRRCLDAAGRFSASTEAWMRSSTTRCCYVMSLCGGYGSCCDQMLGIVSKSHLGVQALLTTHEDRSQHSHRQYDIAVANGYRTPRCIVRSRVPLSTLTRRWPPSWDHAEYESMHWRRIGSHPGTLG